MYEVIYHGSEKVIKKPVFGAGKPYNDYGLAFYCTKDVNLAKEWAVGNEENGIVNSYKIDLDGLTILNLSDDKYSTMEWLATLLKHREVDLYYPIQREARKYILENFSIDVEPYDIITGYRADDSYFTFVRDFLSGTISYEQLNEAMILGDLGKQIAVKSQKAFERLTYMGSMEANAKEWYVKRQNRDLLARKKYLQRDFDRDGLYIVQIIAERMGRDNARLR